MAEPSAQRFEATLTVGRTLGTGCDDVGGTPFEVKSAGVLGAMATWTDPAAVLKMEIWKGQFDQLLVTAAAEDHCVSAQTSASPGLYVVRVCHAPNSQAPAAVHVPVDQQTVYQLDAIYP